MLRSIDEFDVAERDIYAALGSAPPAPALADATERSDAAASPVPRAGPFATEPMAGADPCATACAALASMRRSANHLCELAGEGDRRCGAAKTRVQTAAELVRSRCPACAD